VRLSARRSMTPARRCVVLAASALVVLLAVGCSAGDVEAEPKPWAVEFARVYAEAPNDFVRQIVADGELTIEEMREAAARTQECWDAIGAERWFRESADGSIGPVWRGWDGVGPNESENWAAEDCTLEYFNDLWILWDLIRRNPDAEDFDQLIVDCLISHDLAEPTLTVPLFEEARIQCYFEVTEEMSATMTDEEIMAAEREHGLHMMEIGCRPQLPGGTYLDEGQAWDCIMDPISQTRD